MHTGDLGVVCWFLGSVIWELVHDGPFPGTIPSRIEQLFATIRATYAELGTGSRLTRLTRQQFEHKDGFASLWAKAAESRELLVAMVLILERCDSGSDRDGHRLAAAKALQGMYHIFAMAPMFLSEAESTAALESVNTYYEHHTWLLHNALANNRLLYNVVPKTHYLWHIAFLSRWMNPRYLWCYDAEDFMHVIVATSKACIAGSPMMIVGNKVMENFSLSYELTVSGD